VGEKTTVKGGQARNVVRGVRTWQKPGKRIKNDLDKGGAAYLTSGEVTTDGRGKGKKPARPPRGTVDPYRGAVGISQGVGQEPTNEAFI